MDPFWGKGADGRGMNWNGRILEQLRTELQEKNEIINKKVERIIAERRKREESFSSSECEPNKK